MAVGATRGQAKKRRAKGLGAFALVVYPQLLGQGSALRGTNARAEVGRSDECVQILLRQHVASQLFAHKLIKRFVLIERLDNVIAIRPDAAEMIGVQSVCIAVTGHIEPVVGAVFPVAWTVAQA